MAEKLSEKADKGLKKLGKDTDEGLKKIGKDIDKGVKKIAEETDKGLKNCINKLAGPVIEVIMRSNMLPTRHSKICCAVVLRH